MLLCLLYSMCLLTMAHLLGACWEQYCIEQMTVWWNHWWLLRPPNTWTVHMCLSVSFCVVLCVSHFLRWTFARWRLKVLIQLISDKELNKKWLIYLFFFYRWSSLSAMWSKKTQYVSILQTLQHSGWNIMGVVKYKRERCPCGSNMSFLTS